MDNNRRNFLKMAGLAGLGITGSQLYAASKHVQPTNSMNPFQTKKYSSNVPSFNMCGYSAPKLKTVRIGYIGLGNRGSAAVIRMTHIEGVEIKAICDIREEKTAAVKDKLTNTIHHPFVYQGFELSWKELCERDDIDLVYIATPWHLHTPMAVYAMNCQKHVCVEVPAAQTIDECWELVETSENTKRHCMMLENACYDQFKLLVLNMVRQGLFGEIIHCEGAYIHDLLAGNFAKDKYYDMWRLKENSHRNGNLYPTHGIGPVCQILNINRGDKMDYLVSVSSDDFMMGKMAEKMAEKDLFYKPYAELTYRGNINTSIIKTHKGKTIMLQHDVTSPRPKSGGYLVSGTKGTALQYPKPGWISFANETLPEEWKTYPANEWLPMDEFKKLEEKFNPEILKRIGTLAKEIGGHGGMDLLMDWRTIDCLRNGLPLDQNVYDAALWSSITPLSEWSVNNSSKMIEVPDFTREAWKTNQPVNLSLGKSGDTKIIKQ